MAIALVNDYELVLRGIAEMLRPYSERIDVVELDVAHNPDHRVDVALFDPYGNAQLGLDRVSSLTRDPKVGSVAIYTWTLTTGQRDAAIAAGAHGVIAKSTPPDELVDALLEIAAGGTVFRAIETPGHAPHHHAWWLARERTLFAGDGSIGPGRYSAFKAVRSSSFEGRDLTSKSRMPRLSNWKIATVLPLAKIS